MLVVHDAQKYATFKGNVKAVQGTTTLRATRARRALCRRRRRQSHQGPRHHGIDPCRPTSQGSRRAAGGVGAGAEKGTQISKIEARGEVVITSDQDQTTTSDWALYDVPAQMVTVGGNVVLMQGKNVLKGDRLVIDLKTGESRFENKGNTAAGGRIRALFMPKEAKPGDDSSKDGKSGGKQVCRQVRRQSRRQGRGRRSAAGGGRAAPCGRHADAALAGRAAIGPRRTFIER